MQERIKRTNLANWEEYYKELSEDLKGVPEKVIDYQLKKAEIDLGNKYLDNEGETEPKTTEPLKKLVEGL